MREEASLFNPFTMVGPGFDRDSVELDMMHEMPVTVSLSFHEGLLIMLSKIIEGTRMLKEWVRTPGQSMLDRCASLAMEVHKEEKILTRIVVASVAPPGVRTRLIRFPYRLERIGDMLESVLNCCRIKARDHIQFSEEALNEVAQFFACLLDMMVNLRQAFIAPKRGLLDQVASDGNRLSEKFEEFKEAHWERLEKGECTVEASSSYRDILDSLKSVNEYLVKTANSLLELGDINWEEA